MKLLLLGLLLSNTFWILIFGLSNIQLFLLLLQCLLHLLVQLTMSGLWISDFVEVSCFTKVMVSGSTHFSIYHVRGALSTQELLERGDTRLWIQTLEKLDWWWIHLILYYVTYLGPRKQKKKMIWNEQEDDAYEEIVWNVKWLTEYCKKWLKRWFYGDSPVVCWRSGSDKISDSRHWALGSIVLLTARVSGVSWKVRLVWNQLGWLMRIS